MTAQRLIDKATLEPIVRRVMSRLENGERSLPVAVPESKTGYPRLLVLDFNKWVALARASNGHPEPQGTFAALEAITKAVKAGRLVVPITGVNAFETMGPADAERRRRTASFMVELSGNHSMVHEEPIADAEMRNALQWRFCLGLERLRSIPIRSHIVQRGVNGTIGPKFQVSVGHPAADAVLNDVALEPEISVLALTDGVPRESVRAMKKMERDGAQRVSVIRRMDAHLSMEERLTLELTNLFMDGSLATRLYAQAEQAGISHAVLRDWFADADNSVQFAKAVPSLWVHATLMLHHDKNANNPTHENDGLDYAFLKAAIPYGNYVVTENLWTHIVHQSGLDERFNTKVLADLAKLPALLAADACF